MPELYSSYYSTDHPLIIILLYPELRISKGDTNLIILEYQLTKFLVDWGVTRRTHASFYLMSRDVFWMYQQGKGRNNEIIWPSTTLSFPRNIRLLLLLKVIQNNYLPIFLKFTMLLWKFPFLFPFLSYFLWHALHTCTYFTVNVFVTIILPEPTGGYVVFPEVVTGGGDGRGSVIPVHLYLSTL